MTLTLNNLQKFDMPLNQETKPKLLVSKHCNVIILRDEEVKRFWKAKWVNEMQRLKTNQKNLNDALNEVDINDRSD